MTRIIALKAHQTDKDNPSNKAIKNKQIVFKTNIKKSDSIPCVSYINL